jgi:hypothetical protein
LFFFPNPRKTTIQLVLEAQHHKKYAQPTPLDDGVSFLSVIIFITLSIAHPVYCLRGIVSLLSCTPDSIYVEENRIIKNEKQNRRNKIFNMPEA